MPFEGSGIVFQGSLFLTRSICLVEPWSSQESIYTVSTVELQGKLLSESGDYVSRQAQLLDESIYFYVEEATLLGSLSDLETLVATETELKRRSEAV